MSVIVDVEAITARAVQIKPVRTVLLLLAAPVFVLLLLLRFVWLIPAFFVAAGLKGWESGDKLIRVWQAQAREQANRGG